MSERRGCAGVGLSGPLAEQFAPLTTAPLTSAAIEEVADLAAMQQHATRTAVWAFDAQPGLTWQLSIVEDTGALVFSINDKPVLVADQRRGVIQIGALRPELAAQFVATIGAPVLATALGAVPVHGSSLRRPDGSGLLLVGPSGAGKSSLLTVLADQGWSPISEDTTVVELTPEGAALAWPGPPWVRLARGQPGPAGATPRPDPTDKVAWSLRGRLPTEPTRLHRIVVLDRPGGTSPVVRPLLPAEAIATLPPHVSWLSTAPRATAAFAGGVALARRVPATSLRLSRHPDWAREACALLSDL